MKNLTFKAAMLNDSRTTVERRSNDGQSQRHCKQTPLSKRWKVLMTLVFLFTFAIGQMWGDTFTAAEIVNKSGDVNVGTTKNHVTVSSLGITSTSSVEMWKNGKNTQKENAVSIQAEPTSSGDTYDKSKSFVEIKADRGYKLGTTLSVCGGSTQSGSKVAVAVYWAGAASPTFSSYDATTLSLQAKSATSYPSNIDLTIPDGTRTARIYKKVKVTDATNLISGNASSSKGGGYAAILSVTATAVLAPEIDGDSRMFNDETITLTGYPSGGSWAVVNGPGEIASDGKLTAKGNGTITVSYTVGTASGTKNIEAGVTKTFMFDFTGGAMPEVSGFTLTNLSATFDGANGLKMGSDLQGVRISSEVYEFTNALVSAKANNTSKKVSYNLHDGDQDKTNDPEFATVGTSFAEYNKDIDSQIFTVYRSGGSTTNFNYIVVTAKKVATYTVTFNNNGKGGDAPEAQSGITSGGKATEPTDPVDDNYNFGGWYNKANWQAADAEKWNFSTSTVTRDTTLYAKWTDKSVKSDDATLNAFSIDGYSFTETFAATTLDYTVNMPFYASIPATSAVHATKNDTKANLGDVTYDSTNKKYSVTVTAEDNTTTKTYTITLNIASTPTASSSINIEQLVLDHDKKYDIAAAFAAAHIAYDKKGNTDELDSLKNQDGRNEPYLGLKMKKTDASITVVVPASSTLKVKFGNLPSAGIKVTINGVAQANHTSGNFELAATSAIREVVLAAPSTSTIVFKQIMVGENIQSVQLPWLVTYDAGEHGTCETAKETWKGIDLTLPTATPESGWNFDGWKDDENNDATSPYKPTKDVTLIAQYSAQASPFDLTALIYKIGTAEAVNVGYEDGTFTYNIELPYANYDAITVTPTLKVGTSSIKEGAVLTVSSLPGAATFTVVAAGGSSEQLYTINFTKKAKDGVLLIGTKVTGNTAHGTVYGYGAGTADVNVSSKSGDYTYKLNGGKYVGVTLADGLNFQAGDIVKIRVTDKQGATGFTLYTTKTADSVLIMDTRTNTAIENGIHELTLPAYAGSQSLYLLRQNNDYTTNMNPCVDSIAVYRPMDPVLTAITINDVACEKGEGNTFTITLPEEGTNFASLAVEPTVIRNAAHATTPEAVISNEGAWKAGDNTYRVMDKDGDYTDYTITITLQGQAPAPVIATQPAGVAYCAGNEPTLEVEATGNELHYAWFKEAGETDEAVGEDAASYTIASAGTYYVIITNHVDGKLDKSVTSENAVVTLNAGAEITAQPAALQVVDAGDAVELSVTATNATAYQWYKGGVLIEGAQAATYNFTAAVGAATYYCVVTGACGDVQSNNAVVYVESGDCNTAGYGDGASNVFGTKGSEIALGSYVTYKYSKSPNDFSIIVGSTSTGVKAHKMDGDFYVWTANTELAAITTSVLTKGTTGGKYCVVFYDVAGYQPDDSHIISVVELTAGLEDAAQTFDVTPAPAGAKCARLIREVEWNETTYGESSQTYIYAFRACALVPAEKPVISGDLSDLAVCTFGSEDLSVTVDAVSDGGTLSYQWYNADGDVAITGEESASYTPMAEGSYYVIVTNTKANAPSSSTKSATAEVTQKTATAITGFVNASGNLDEAKTLSVTAKGDGTITYQWQACDENGYVTDPAVLGTEASYDVTITEAKQYYLVTVHSGCGADVTQVLFAEKWTASTPKKVDGSMTWNWESSAWNAVGGNIQFANGSDEELMANVTSQGRHVPNVDGENGFRSDMLYGTGTYVWRTSAKFFQGTQIRFITTTPGRLYVTYRNTGGDEPTRHIEVVNNDITLPADGTSTAKDWKRTNAIFVRAGEVIINCIASEENGATRIKLLEFDATPDYDRDVNPQYYGTICLPKAGVMTGAMLFQVAYMDYKEDGVTPYKVYYDQVENGTMEAGMPYIFLAEQSTIGVYYTATAEATAKDHNGLHGTLTDMSDMSATGIYMLYNNQVLHSTNPASNLPAKRAYLKIDEIPGYENPNYQAPAPKFRRISTGFNAPQVATGIDELNASEAPVKMIIDGKMYILRGEKMYDATGRLVK